MEGGAYLLCHSHTLVLAIKLVAYVCIFLAKENNYCTPPPYMWGGEYTATSQLNLASVLLATMHGIIILTSQCNEVKMQVQIITN